MGTVIKNSSHKTKTGLISNKDLASRVSSTGSSSSKETQAIDDAAKKAGTFNSPQNYGSTAGAPEGYAFNPVTGKNEKLAGVSADYNPITAGANADPLPGVLKPDPGIVSSTDGQRDLMKQNQATASEILNGLNSNTNIAMYGDYAVPDVELYSQTEDGGDELENIRKLAADLNVFSSDEQDEIDRKIDSEGKGWDKIIEDQRADNEQGMARATVSAGERGGFMNTQFAGTAAGPRDNGAIQSKIRELEAMGIKVDLQNPENFIGPGGQLWEAKGVYDRTVADLQSKRSMALIAAENAAKEAIRTRKTADLKVAQEMYQLAQDTSKDLITLTQNKAESINKIVDSQRTQAQQDLQYMLNTFGAGAFDSNIDALKAAAAKAGYDPELFSKGIQTLKEKKDLGELREVGGSLYNVSYDKNGNAVAKLVVSKGAGGGGGGNTTVGNGQFTQAQLMSPEIQDYADRVQRKEITPNGVPMSSDPKKNKREMVRIVLEQREQSIGMTGVKNAPTGTPYNQTQVITVVKDQFKKNTGNDGYVNPATYQALRSDIIANYPQLLGWYDKEYPKNKWISPQEIELMNRV